MQILTVHLNDFNPWIWKPDTFLILMFLCQFLKKLRHLFSIGISNNGPRGCTIFASSRVALYFCRLLDLDTSIPDTSSRHVFRWQVSLGRKARPRVAALHRGRHGGSRAQPPSMCVSAILLTYFSIPSAQPQFLSPMSFPWLEPAGPSAHVAPCLSDCPRLGRANAADAGDRPDVSPRSRNRISLHSQFDFVFVSWSFSVTLRVTDSAKRRDLVKLTSSNFDSWQSSDPVSRQCVVWLFH
jgi:hypothetical protein